MNINKNLMIILNKKLKNKYQHIDNNKIKKNKN